jgi:hypothetical protein
MRTSQPWVRRLSYIAIISLPSLLILKLTLVQAEFREIVESVLIVRRAIIDRQQSDGFGQIGLK